MLRWRYADPDLTTPPLHLVRRVGDRITGHAMAMLGKGNSIEPPVLEIIDLQALDHDRAAVRALVAALLRLAPGWGAAKVRLQVVSDSLLRDMGDLARKARREGGWGHCHAAFAPDIQTTEVDGPSDWRPTPFDGDYAFCVRPVPKRPPIPSGPWASSQDAPIATPA